MKHITKPFLFLIGMCLLLQGATASVAATPQEIKGLYKSLDNGLFWDGTSQIEKNRKKVADIIEKSTKHGMSPDDFSIKELRAVENFKKLSESDAQAADAAYTYALWRYANALNGAPLLDSQFIELALSPDMGVQVENLAPKSVLYQKLKDRLAEIDVLLEKRGDNTKFPRLHFENKTMHVGDTHPDVPLLRARMLEFGVGTQFGDAPYVYDLALSEAVKEYQTQNGLTADGIVGSTTLKYLNRTLNGEREQVVLNMKRLRDPIWRNRPDLRIDVDIARYWLTAYEDGVTQFEMPVVVGSTKRQTVRFSTVMTGVRLNPGWTLPPTIKTEDYIPKLRENPEWVSEQGVKIYADWSHNSEPIDPTTVDWTMLSDGEIKAMRMYKSAGASNPLGQYRFLMNNKYDIYLHDTNAKGLFGRSMRAKSSGCVRIYNPRKVAKFLLKDDPSWTSDKIDEVLASGKTYDVGAKRSIPVYFDYKTAWIDGNDKLVMGVDVYGFDKDVRRDILEFKRQTKQTISKLLNPINITKTMINESNDTQDVFPISLF